MGIYNNEKDHTGRVSMFLRRWPRIKWDKTGPCLLVLGVGLTFFNLKLLLTALEKVDLHCAAPAENNGRPNKTFAVHGKRVDSGYLFHVLDTFHSLGYARVNVSEDWDVLWSHDYPFTVLKERIQEMKPGQKVNHFPGSGFITNKMNLATSEYSFVPRAFQLPKGKEDLIQYAAKNPSTMFVQKSNNHRGIKIEKIDNLDLTKSETFIQAYVSNPFLIDGHKFDIGVYVVVTSLEPLRLYRYAGDILFRFCPVTYHPFDPEILDKYVVGDDYLPLWKVDSLKHAHNQGFRMQEAFDNFIRQKRKDPKRIWAQVDSAIRTIYLTKESLMIETWRKFDKKRNFFELVRFDFVIDEDLNVFLMEVNMSPNLSSAHFPPNRVLYEQVLFSTFSLVGISNHLTTGTRTHTSRLLTTKQVLVNSTVCADCLHCEKECKLCPSCTSEEDLDILKEAHLEHWNRMDFKRIFPYHGVVTEKEGLSPANKWMSLWYDGKCSQDPSWCT